MIIVGVTDGIRGRRNPSEYILATKYYEYERALMQFLELEKEMQVRILRYLQTLSEIQREEKNE